MILLDTHVLLWSVDQDERLGRGAQGMLSGDANVLFYSTMTAWELGMLTSKNRIRLTLPPEALLAQVREYGVGEIAVSGDIAFDAGTLRDLHGDPCDRILIATARAVACPLLTADEKILAYAAAGHLKAIDARL